MLAIESIVVRNSAVLDAKIDNDIVLMNSDNGQYYALTATSRAIWERLKEPVRVRDLCIDLADAFQTPLATVEADTLEFLSYLAEQKIIASRADRE